MIDSAHEFVHLRSSVLPTDYNRSTYEEASIQTWLNVIENYPEYKTWVVHNKTVPICILEKLALDDDSNVRSAVARKRKINELIINTLADDADEQVRISLACNTKISIIDLNRINRKGSDWYITTLEEIIQKKQT